MNYERVYNEFIQDRRLKEQFLIDSGEYKERHHIKPKALGGDNTDGNLVYLSAEDHIRGHVLLAKVYGGKMWAAVHIIFSGYNRKKVIPTKKMVANVVFARKRISENMKIDNPASRPEVRIKIGLAGLGRKHTEEWKIEASKRLTGEKHPMHGKHHSEQARKKQSESAQKRGMCKSQIKSQFGKRTTGAYFIKEDVCKTIDLDEYYLLKAKGLVVGTGTREYQKLKNPDRKLGSTGSVPCFFIKTKTFGSLKTDEYYKQKKLGFVVHNKSLIAQQHKQYI